MATLALSLAGQAVGAAVGGPVGAMVGRALGALAGSAIDNMLFADTTEPGGRDIALQGSAEGGPIPRLYGWNRLAGNIIWATELERIAASGLGAKAMGGSQEDSIVASFALGLCEGEVAHLGRIWADGQLLDTSGLNLRFYRGTNAQMPDSLIEAVQGAGNAPAYRGLCYLVFERLPLAAFGNRIPNITVELCRVVGDLEPAIKAVTLIPAATEFGYDPVPRVRVVSPGVTRSENAHLGPGQSDWTLSLDELQALCPNLKHVALVVSWFGNDLRAGHCTIAPRVEAVSRTIKGTSWQVSGIGRSEAELVSTHAGGPAYGGTPSDASILAAIADLKARGLEVTLYPFVMMDIAADNVLPDPYGGAAQPAYPWRGRITCDPAPGEAGTVDKTAAAATQIAGFVGAAAPAHFSASGQTVAYSGPSEWSYRRMVLHYARLCAMAGGVDAFVIGSELRGLTSVRSGAASFPFVDALVALAADVRAILGAGTRLTYAADWSEYAGMQPPEAPGDRLFHLDPLWADSNIDAIGIDYYPPQADWRDGANHLDAASARGIHELDYLRANITGGENFDWYYANDTDRQDQTRTPITDGLHGEPWIWRAKDMVSFWSLPHHNRIDGVRSATPTGFVPQGKPLWLTELGCGAIDKGANAPSAFGDAKSSEDRRPPFSAGTPDPVMQRQLLRAHMAHWRPDSPDFIDASNPLSAIYGGRMLDPERLYLWTWDARPYPAFPLMSDVWSDGANHATGHWLNGRLGGFGAGELAQAMAADDSVAITTDPGGPFIQGYAVTGLNTLRASIEPVLDVAGLDWQDADGALMLRQTMAGPTLPLDPARLAVEDGPVTSRTRTDPAEVPARLTLGYTARLRNYLSASCDVQAESGSGQSVRQSALVLDASAAHLAAHTVLATARAPGDSLRVLLPPSLLALEPGDVIALTGDKGGPFVVSEIRDGLAREISARPLPPREHFAGTEAPPTPASDSAGVATDPVLFAAHLPGAGEAPNLTRLMTGAFADPWPGDVSWQRSDGFELARATRAANLGHLLADLPPATSHVHDRGNMIEVTFYAGHPASATALDTLNGVNRLLVMRDNGSAELVGFETATLVAPATYRLSGLLRGLGGTFATSGIASAGALVALFDDRLVSTDVPTGWLGGTVAGTVYAGALDVTGTGFAASLSLDPARPLPPAGLRARRDPATGDVQMTFRRAGRIAADNWELADIPLYSVPEVYDLTILDGAVAVRTERLSAAGYTYPAAQQAADFGSLPVTFAFSVAQVDPVLGTGHVAQGVFDA